MADQHNANIPALTNAIADDIPDIKENLEFHKDAFQRIFRTWSDTDNSAAVLDTIGFNNGTYGIDFPTNGMAAAKIMLGNSNTIAWFYLNTAPPGWKVIATGADTILAISGGAGLYNANGGTAGGESWANLKAHVHTGPSHTHGLGSMAGPDHTHTLTSGNSVDSSYDTSPGGLVMLSGGDGRLYTSQTGASTITQSNNVTGSPTATALTGAMAADGTGNTGAQSTADVRPTASIGKLFQLDTA